MQRLVLAFTTLILSSACSSSSSARSDVEAAGGAGGAPTAPSGGNAGSLGDAGTADVEPPLDSNWPEVKQWFGNLETLAGKGELDGGNDWLPEFEGGPASEAELSRPHMAMADAEGNVYIADKEAHAIRKVDLEGRIHTVAGTNAAGDAPDEISPATEGALSNPNGLWVQPDGTLYLLDLDNRKVRKVTPEGVMSTVIVLETLSVGRGLWVAEDEGEAFIASGETLLHWTPNDGVTAYGTGFSSLGMVLRDEEARVLVGDRGLHQVLQIADNGMQIPLAGNTTTGAFVDGGRATANPFVEPRAVWPFAGGLFVGMHNSCNIAYVDSAGAGHRFLYGSTAAHSGDGEPFDTPGLKIGEVRSVSVTRKGELIIVESDVGFVRRVRPRNPDAPLPASD